MLHKEKKITIGYNVVLFVIFLVFHAMNAVLEYKEEQYFFVDKLFDYDFVFGVSLFVILFFVSATIGVWVIRSFWGRFISNMFQIRALTVNEAVSIVLVLSILLIN